jgi:hypothetical protein
LQGFAGIVRHGYRQDLYLPDRHAVTGDQPAVFEIRRQCGARGADRSPEWNIVTSAKAMHAAAVVTMFMSQQHRIDVLRVDLPLSTSSVVSRCCTRVAFPRLPLPSDAILILAI